MAVRSLWTWAVREPVPGGTNDTSQEMPLSSLTVLLTTVGCESVSWGSRRTQKPKSFLWFVDG